MRVKTYELIEDAVDSGVRSGLAKAAKWGLLEFPSESGKESAVNVLTNYILTDVCRYMDFTDESE